MGITQARYSELLAKEQKLDGMNKPDAAKVDASIESKKPITADIKDVNLKSASDAAQQDITEDKTQTYKCGACGARTTDKTKCDNCGVEFE